MKCMSCEKEARREVKPYETAGVKLGEFVFWTCDSCNESWVEEETMQKMEAAAKEKGVWGIETRTKVSFSGNSLILRIPKKIAEFLHIDKGSEVLLRPEKKKLVAEIV